MPTGMLTHRRAYPQAHERQVRQGFARLLALVIPLFPVQEPPKVQHAQAGQFCCTWLPENMLDSVEGTAV